MRFSRFHEAHDNHELQELIARLEGNKKMPIRTWATYTFKAACTKEEALGMFLSYLKWVAVDRETHIMPIPVIERNEMGRVHIHTTLLAPKHLRYNDLHGRWWRNQGLSHHVNYKQGEGAIPYMVKGHELVELERAVVCPNHGKGRCRKRCCYQKWDMWNIC